MAFEPLISVCIPSYNSEKYIARTVQSVLDQTFRGFELVVMDDCSTDGTAAVVKNFKDPRIRLIQNEQNLGMARNWSKALSYSKAKYVKLLCGDDVLHPECLARQSAILENPSHASVVLVLCNRTVIDAKDRVVLRRRFPFAAGVVDGTTLLRKSVRWGSNLLGEPAVGLFRREALRGIDEFDPANPYAIDLGLWAKVLKHGDACIDTEPLASFRISGEAVSAKIGLQQASYFRKFVKGLRKDAFYHISFLDAFCGCALSLPWCALRHLFIQAHLRKAQFAAAAIMAACSSAI